MTENELEVTFADEFKDEALRLLRAAQSRAGLVGLASAASRVNHPGLHPDAPPSKWMETMYADVADVAMWLVVIRMRLRELRGAIVDDPIWNLRKNMTNPKVTLGRKPMAMPGSTHHWFTNDRWVRATRVKAYTFDVAWGDLGSDGDIMAKGKRRVRIQGWENVVNHAQNVLTGQYDPVIPIRGSYRVLTPTQRREMGNRARARRRAKQAAKSVVGKAVRTKQIEIQERLDRERKEAEGG